MLRRPVVLVVLTVVLLGCQLASTSSSPPPAPPAPSAPAGWKVLGTIERGNGDERAGANFFLQPQRTALSFACIGAGTVLVLVGEDMAGPGHTASPESVVFGCGAEPGELTTGRVELDRVPQPDDIVTVLFLPGDGTLGSIPSSATVSVEQKPE